MEDDTVFHTMFGEINLNNVQGELRKYVLRKVDVEFDVGKQIGKGGFGQVNVGKRKSDQLRVAIKQLYPQRLDPQDYLSYCREIKVLSMTTNHPCLVSLVGFTTKYPYTIITPFVENGALFDRLGKRKEGTPRLTTANKTIIAAGIAYGMIHLHEMAIIHRDLKSMNILLDKKLHPKICDFGISKSTRNETASHMTIGLGTPHWMAPEMMEETDSTYTHKVDIYAYGILLWEILTEDIPFKDAKNAFQVQQRVLDGKRPAMPPTGPQSVKRLITRCWSTDPNERPEFEEIYEMFANGDVKFGEGDDESVSAYLRDLESHKFCTTRRTFNIKSMMHTRQTPESLDNLSSMISVSNVMEFFRQCKVELSATNDPSVSRNIYDMMTAVMNNGSAFVAAMIESRVTESFKWDVQGSLEHLHRVIATAVHFIPSSFTCETISRMMDNIGIKGVRPFTILHALSVIFQKHKDEMNTITPIVTRFLERAKDMIGPHSVIAVVQLLCIVWKYAQDLCRQNIQSFNGALYYALKTNNPHACHDVYMFYAANANLQWPMNDNLLLAHLQIEGTQLAALSYMIRLYIPVHANYIPILFNLAEKYETAGAILCNIANRDHAATLFGTKEAISGIPKLGVESGIRLILLLTRIPTCRKLIFTSVDVLRYLKNLLENKHDLFVPIKELIKFICTSKEDDVFPALKESGLLVTFDTLSFSENADDDMRRALVAHAHCDSHLCPDNYKYLIDQYKANMWRSGEVFTKYVLAALSPLTGYPEAQEYIRQRGILQVILQGDITEDLKRYVVYIFRKCNVPLNL